MESKAKLFGHPAHQMLVVFPLGLLGTSVVFDLICRLGDSPYAAGVSYALIAAGLVGGLIAAPWGTRDWLGGELVGRLGVGVSTRAHLDARSSLDGPAELPAVSAERPRASPQARSL